MKILALCKKGRLEKISNPDSYAGHEIIYVSMGSSDEEIINACKDAEVLISDAMGTVSENVIKGLNNLKMIHSEGVGFQGIDLEAARKRGIFVCNCKGMNAQAVAEQAILLMLGLLREVKKGNQYVNEGRQIELKESYMKNGTLKEISDCTVGLYGFGDIAKILAKIVKLLGGRVLYYDMYRASMEVEKEYGVTYVELEELKKESDILSLHIPVTPGTKDVVNKEFLAGMKKGAYLINTARGELVDTIALIDAIREGWIAGAGLDCIAGEPVGLDNPIVLVEDEISDKLLLSCHVGGITKSSFARGYEMLWENVKRIEKGEKPSNIVNNL